MSLSEILTREMAPFVVLSGDQLATLEKHYALMLAWNARMNLTTVTKLPDAGLRHYCESLFLASFLPQGRVVDIGTGPGFPGVPCAVLRSDCEFVLVESNQRKAIFIKEASRGLRNVSVVAQRAELVKGQFDCVISRAVDPTEVLRLKLARRFLLLVGEGDASAAELGPGASDEGPLGRSTSRTIRVPWGERRVILDVSRGTPGY